MCGICGDLRFDGRAVGEEPLRAMRDTLCHRGPDSDGLFLSADRRAGLGFRRLRIIDLSSNASQPMANEDGSIHVVFNGEIYNYRALRERLLASGHQFRSRSDTETIVHLFEEKGPDAIAELDGMFAIAIWDERAQRLTLARDRAGKKPLFIFRSDRLVAFASEIKSFFAHPEIDLEIDPAAVPQYFIQGFVPHPTTFYKGVTELEPGSWITIDAGGQTAMRRYWHMSYPDASMVRDVPRGEAVAQVRELVTRAVERRLISDVPLGAFLSGGLDSTIVVGLMSRLMTERVKTFSIGFEGDGRYDETGYARIAADRFGTEHTEFRVTPDAIDLVDTLIWHHDGPFGDSSAVPTYVVSRLTRQHVTVVLTGDGGDEVFAGYNRIWAAVTADRVPLVARRAGRVLTSALPAPRHERQRLAAVQRFFSGAARPLHERATLWNALFFDDLELLVRPEFASAIDKLQYAASERACLEGRTPLSRLLHLNFTSYLADDLLVKTDRCTMANSLEARAPFLDRALVEYVATLPDVYKLDGRRTKAILRDAFADLIPPNIEKRSKMGFGVPVGAWFRTTLRDYARDVLLSPSAKHCEFLNRSYVESIVYRHQSGDANLGPQLWALICFERWLQLLPEWRRERNREQHDEQHGAERYGGFRLHG
jgi:asparagine synthase (glutamine-hydrolysing)